MVELAPDMTSSKNRSLATQACVPRFQGLSELHLGATAEADVLTGGKYTPQSYYCLQVGSLWNKGTHDVWAARVCWADEQPHPVNTSRPLWWSRGSTIAAQLSEWTSCKRLKGHCLTAKLRQ